MRRNELSVAMCKRLNRWLFFIACLIFFSFSVTAQPDYIGYYKEINRAEVAICDSNFSEALNHFENAFLINPDKPFTKHLLNAFFAAMDVKKYSFAETYFSKILSRGLGQEFINGHILKYYNGESLQQIQSMLKKYPNDTIRKHPLIREINEMVKWDQDVRQHFSKLNDGAYMTDSTYIADSVNAAHLRRIFREYGVPNETVLGNNKAYNNSKNAVDNFDIIIHHHNAGQLGGMPSHSLDSFLWEAVRTLDYDIHQFEFLININATNTHFIYKKLDVTLPTTIMGCYYNGKIYPEYYDDASEQFMNNQRGKLSLENLSDVRRKITAGNQNVHSVLHKYQLGYPITVIDVIDEIRFKDWLDKHGEKGIAKKSIFKNQGGVIANTRFDVGIIKDKYVINQSNYKEFMRLYAAINKEYVIKKLRYSEWEKSKTNLPWNYHAEIIANPVADSNKKTAMEHASILPSGYKMLVESEWSFELTRLNNIEMLFHDNLLIWFKAEIPKNFDRIIIQKLGEPNQKHYRNDTVLCKNNIIITADKTYSWKKRNLQMNYRLIEDLDEKCKKKTTAFLEMQDLDKYNVYLNQVSARKTTIEGD